MSTHTHRTTVGTKTYTSTATAAASASDVTAAIAAHVLAYHTAPITVPFGSRPASGPLTFTGATDVAVSGKTFANIPFPQAAIRLDGCKGTLHITDCDFDALAWDAIDMVGGCDLTAIEIGNLRIRNLGTQTPSWYQAQGSRAGADILQMDHSIADGLIHDIRLYGAHNEDLVNIAAASGGRDASHPLIFDGLHCQSPLPPDPLAWLSTSGSCFMVEGAAHVILRNSTYLNMAQGGLGFNGGTDIHYTDNIVYIAKRANSNVGLYSLVDAAPVEMARNRVFCLNAAGQPNPAWFASGQPAGYSTNVLQDASIVPGDLAVTL